MDFLTKLPLFSRSHAPRGNGVPMRRAGHSSPQRGQPGFPRGAWEPERKLPLWFYGAVLVLASVTVYQGIAALRQARNINPADISIEENTPPLLVFVKAQWFSQTGKPNEAIRLYTSLADTPDVELRTRALHNLASLYLQDAAQRWNAHGVLEAAHVSTEVELAKDYGRAALRLQPELWDARYNLEYAFRITPPPKEKAKANFKGSKASVFSTLPGLPGGGP